MTVEDFIKAMGFEYDKKTYAFNDEGVPRIRSTHMITHPDVPGLFLAGQSLENIAKNIIPCVKVLTRLNEKPLKIHEVDKI